MSAASKTLRPATSLDTSKSTFSQASEAGVAHSGWLVCPMSGDFGPGAVHASHSVTPDLAKGLAMRAISGPLFAGWSPSAALQSSLESRLHRLMEGCGSPEYELTWKQWAMPAGEPICALRALALRKSGSGCGGSLVGYPAANARDWKGATLPDTVRADTGKVRLDQLDRVAELLFGSVVGPILSSGPAPMETHAELPLDGWDTPRAGGGGQVSRGQDRKDELLLAGQAKAAGYPTPNVDDANNQTRAPGEFQSLVRVARTLEPEMESWKLNPAFSLWLMGFPTAWVSCGARAMQSCRRVRRNLSKQPTAQLPQGVKTGEGEA